MSNAGYQWEEEGEILFEEGIRPRIVGRANRSIPSKPPRKHTRCFEQALEIMPKLAERAYPPNGAKAERATFNYQARRFVAANNLDFSKAREALQSHLPHSSVPTGFEEMYVPGISKIKEQDIRVRAVIERNVKRSSTPGFPWVTFGSLNRDVLDNHFELVIKVTIERLNLLLNFDTESATNLAPSDLVKLGLVDPVSLFIKDEPHTLQKLMEQRYRLIFGVSLTEFIIQCLLYGEQNQAEIKVAHNIPPKSGMGLTDHGISDIWLYYDTKVSVYGGRGTVVHNDCSGYDWTMQEYGFISDHLRRQALNGAHDNSFWTRISKAHMFCMARKVFLFSDGTMIEQTIPGVLPSGMYNTSSTNSNIRATEHFHIAIKQGKEPACATMGDDCFERELENITYEYSLLGRNVKPGKPYNPEEPEQFSFCSHTFIDGIAIPENIVKMLVTMLDNLPVTYLDTLARYEQFVYDIRHCPNKSDLIALVNRSGWWQQCPQAPRFSM